MCDNEDGFSSDESVNLPPLDNGIVQNPLNVSQSKGSYQQCTRVVGSSSNKTFIPMVDDSTKPKIGMDFNSIEDAYKFYNLYAKEAGFSVRRSSEKRGSDGLIMYKLFVCAKEGKKDNRASNNSVQLKRICRETREGCKAYMSLKKSKMGPTYSILKFCEEHTHPLSTPRETELLRSHRKETYAKRKLIDTFESTNLPPFEMIFLKKKRDGYGDIGCKDQDVYKRATNKKEVICGVDAQMLYEYFREKAEQNSSFAFNIKKNDDNSITHAFWADTVTRINYRRFGTVVSFDTTYNTNYHNMIFTSFTGVNHHYRSIVLGCGFLRRETVADFVWLFEEWRKAMLGVPPHCLTTDWDPDITDAVARVFPNAVHRYCSWHIIDKATKNLGNSLFKEDFNLDLKDVVYNVETQEEFETRWSNFLEQYKLTEAEWLQDLYEIRSRWVPAYQQEKFFVTTQRSGRINKFLKQYVNKHNSYCEFMITYERFMNRQKHLELADDYKTFNSRPMLKTAVPIEKQMANIFTRRVFLRFQEELFYSIAVHVSFQSENEDESNFIACHQSKLIREGANEKPEDCDRSRKVVLKKATLYATCSCHKFEFEGIPCRHVLSVLKYAGVDKMPSQYILERWTPYANKREALGKNEALVKAIADESLVARHSFLSHLFGSLVDEACLTKEAFQHAVELLANLQKELQEINQRAITQNTNGKEKHLSNDDDLFGY